MNWIGSDRTRSDQIGSDELIGSDRMNQIGRRNFGFTTLVFGLFILCVHRLTSGDAYFVGPGGCSVGVFRV